MQILNNFWAIFFICLFLAITICWIIWMHMIFKYPADEPSGNGVDNEYSKRGDL